MQVKSIFEVSALVVLGLFFMYCLYVCIFLCELLILFECVEYFLCFVLVLSIFDVVSDFIFYFERKNKNIYICVFCCLMCFKVIIVGSCIKLVKFSTKTTHFRVLWLLKKFF